MSSNSAVAKDLLTNLRAAERLVNVVGAQRDAEERAYTRGWEECGKAMAYILGETWEAGYDAAVADRVAEWERLSQWIRARADSPQYAERRAAELAACQPRPGDFPGLENDPTCLEPIRASVESIVNKHTRAAA